MGHASGKKDGVLRSPDKARDKFLLCAYTGLSIGDADEVTWNEVWIQPAGMIINWDRNKTGSACYIPF